MSQKIVGVILTAIALVLLVFFIRIELYFLLGLPIMLLVVGIIVTLSAVSGEASISSNETTSEETLRYSSPSGNKQDKQGRIVGGWILAIIGLIQLIVFLIIGLYFLLFLPIIFLIIGSTLIAIGLNEDKESATVQSYLSPSNAGTKTDDGPISHDSEEYRRWKEGK